MNPLETIENDKRLKTIIDGLQGMWHFPEEFLALVVYHTDDFDVALEAIELYADHDMEIEEALYQAMDVEDFREKCLDSEYLDNKKCEELIKEADE